MSENITINLTQPKEEIKFSYTQQDEEIVFSFSEAARGPQGEAAVTNATVNAAIEEDPAATRDSLELGPAALEDFSNPPPIGDGTPNTGAFTTLSTTGTATLPHIHGSIAGNLYIHVRNDTGSTLTRGTPIYITGNVGDTDRVRVAAADNTNTAKMPAVGLLEEDLDHNEDGNAIIVGELDSANTNAYSLNQELYVGAGAITGTKPTTGEVQSVGVVSRVQTNTGVIVVNMQGRRTPDGAFATAAQGTLADGAAQKSANLSDLTSASTARTNLGLGTAATTDSTAYATAAQGTDERVPTSAGLTSKFGTNKASVVNGDKITILDSAASDAPKHILWSLIVSTLTTAFDALYVGLTGNQTVAGNKTLSGQLELTGQAATNTTSAMTRALAGTEPFFNVGVMRNVVYPPAFANSGTTGAAALTIAGDRLFSITSGTANSGWGRASIARGINQAPAISGNGIRFNKKIGVSIAISIGASSFSNIGNIFRLVVGSNQTPAADGVDPITYRGFGIEFKSRGSSHDWRLFAHNGTAISFSAWTNTGMTSGTPLNVVSTLAVVSDGAGNITGYFGADCTRTLSTITLTGGPTAQGASAQAFVDVHVANSTTGTASLSVAGFDAKIYSE